MRRARTIESGRCWSVLSPSISPIGMVSISVRSMPRPWAKRIKSSYSSSFTPLSATALSLILRPARSAHAFGDEHRAEPVKLLEREQVRLRQEGHVLRHAVDAAEVAAVGDRNPDIGHVWGEGVDHRPDRGAGDELSLHDLCNSRLRDTA